MFKTVSFANQANTIAVDKAVLGDLILNKPSNRTHAFLFW